MNLIRLGGLSIVLVLSLAARGLADTPSFTREFDIIYHKQYGFALTMEKVTPRDNANGAAIIMVMSGGWFSNHNSTLPHEPDQLPEAAKQTATELVERGFALFYVVHGTQPKFTIREIHEQISAAVRHIRHHADEYQVDPKRIGIMGSSAGGHLSLLQGTKGQDGQAEAGGKASKSSRVQAVVAYFPPTDFVNYGQIGAFFDDVVRDVLPDGNNPFLQALDLLEFDEKEVRLTKVLDAERLAAHYRDIGPYYNVSADDAPTLLLHGDADRLVPLQQSQRIAAKFSAVGVPHQLFLKEGGDHGWPPSADEVQMIADWFETHLAQTNDEAPHHQASP